MILVGVAGGARHGKDSIGDHICRAIGSPDHQVRRISFATPIKEIVCSTFMVDMDFIEKWKVRPEVPPGFDIPMREALIRIGDGFRQIKSTVWIDLAVRRLVPGVDVGGILPDVRYANELSTIKSKGGVTVLVYRPGHENDIQNESEAQMRRVVNHFLSNGIAEGQVDLNTPDVRGAPSPYPLPAGADMIDVFIKNDGTLDELHAKVDRWAMPLVTGHQ